MTRLAPIDPFKPVPWETFTLVETRAAKPSRFTRIFLSLAIIAIATGALIALSVN